MPDLIVRELATGKEIKRVSVSNPFSTRRGIEKYEVVMTGMLINMNTDLYYIDDSEIDASRSSSNG